MYGGRNLLWNYADSKHQQGQKLFEIEAGAAAEEAQAPIKLVGWQDQIQDESGNIVGIAPRDHAD